MSERSQIYNVKSTKESVSQKGNDVRAYSLDQETVHALIEALTAIADNPRGGKLSFHTKDAQTRDGSRKFRSSFFFVDGIQEPGAGYGGGGQGQGYGQRRGSFKPKQRGMSQSTMAAARRTLNTQVE